MLFLAIFLVLLVQSSYAVTCYGCEEHTSNSAPDLSTPCYVPNLTTDILRVDCKYCYVVRVWAMDSSGNTDGNILLELV